MRKVAAWMLCLAAACSDADRAAVNRDDDEASALDAGTRAADGSATDRSRLDDSSARPTDAAGSTRPQALPEGLRLRSDVQPITRAEEARAGVFIPPYRECTRPREGQRGEAADGKVCTNVAISGSTEEGKYFPDYGSCDVVMTQRPFWSAPPARASAPDDPRLQDQAYLKELSWVTAQVATTGCVCCHDSRVLGKQASQWDISLGPLWLDSLSDTGLALFAGLADSSVLGAYPPEQNAGFDRNVVGIPTTDNARMQRFMLAELTRRDISEESARAVPPFGGPIYDNRIAKPNACKAGEGVDAEGRLQWQGGTARYVYVMAADSDNPGVPPNLDLPEGTLFRLDVLASEPAVAAGLRYGTTPVGSFQAYPENMEASALTKGTTYHLTVLRDVGLPIANCLFEFGAVFPAQTVASDAGTLDAGPRAPDASSLGGAGSCTLAGGDAQGFGAPCSDAVNHSDCPCAASYCAIQPGSSVGSCTKTACTQAADSCPSGWSCFDLSRFAPGQPAICTR